MNSTPPGSGSGSSTGGSVSSAGFSGAGAGMVSASSGQVEAFLGRGSKAAGNLTFTGPAEIDGAVEGEVHAKDRLTIGESAVVNAKVSGSEIVVKGTVTGDIVASKKLSLKRPARITGNITAASLSIEEGVVFEGKCSMSTSGVVDGRQAAKSVVNA